MPARKTAARPASAGYSGTPLVKKLGIKPDTTLALVSSPERFEETLRDLPESVVVRKDLKKSADVIVLFVRSEKELTAGFPKAAAALAEKGRLWLSWPKKASGIVTDLTEDVIRDFGLATGWVDYKVCAVDATWSGLCFARRKA